MVIGRAAAWLPVHSELEASVVQRRRLFCLVLVAILTVLTLPISSSPSGLARVPATRFEIFPEPSDDPAVTASGYFIYELEPGAGEAGFVRLENPSDTPVTIELAAADATTAQTGGSAYAPPGVTPVGVGAWLELARSQVTLEPGTSRRIRFRVRVPDETPPGQYLAGITAYVPTPPSSATPEVDRGESQATVTLNVQTRYVLGVQINVPGSWTPRLAIETVRLSEQDSGSSLGLHLRNTGTTMLRPAGSVIVADATGARVLHHEITMGTFVTGTEVVYPVAWPSTLPSGSYRVHVELDYSDGLTATYDGQVEAAGSTVPRISIAETRVDASHDPASGDVQFVTLGVTIDNPGAAVAGARLTLTVARDGAPLEELVIGTAMTLSKGSAEVTQRYLPPSGWAPGVYDFTVTLDLVDPTSGTVTRLSESTSTFEVT